MPVNSLALQSAESIQLGDLLTESEAAEALNVAVRTLRNWRSLRKGPRWVRIGQRIVRYKRADLLTFIDGGKA